MVESLHTATQRRLFERLLSIGVLPTDTVGLRERKRLFVGGIYLAIIPVSFFIILSAGLGHTYNAGLLSLAIIGTLMLLVGLHLRPRLFHIWIHLSCLLALLSITGLTLLFGGLMAASAAAIWAGLAPITALIFLGKRAALWWLGLFGLAIIVLAAFPVWIPGLYAFPLVYVVLNLITFTATVVAFLHYFIRQRDVLQDRSDMLLRNIFPEPIVERLKNQQQYLVEHYDEASVLFADVVGFTPLTTQMRPNEIVDMLNEVFSAFDQLVEGYGLEKIKTIGDCYMVAAGVPQRRPDHAEVLLQLALDMQALVASRDFLGQQLRFRIGINSGPLIAGVIGRHKFIYDLWGDTVNTASRMESHGAGGQIQVTEATFRRIRHQYQCEPKGVLPIKGKGEMPVWHVLGKTAAPDIVQ